MLSGDPAAVRAIDGSFALVAVDGITVRMARSMDRPMRYFLAKRQKGPALYVADRVDTLQRALERDGLGGAVSSELHADGARALRRRTVARRLSRSRSDVHAIFHAAAQRFRPIWMRSVGATSPRWPMKSAKWLTRHRTQRARRTDRRRLFRRHRQRRGVPGHLSRDAEARAVAGPAESVRPESRRRSRRRAGAIVSGPLGLSLFLEEIDAVLDDLDVAETLRVIEDYKTLDVECAAMGLRLCQGIRERYPEWRHLADGDGGDENLKDYPLEAAASSRSAVSSTT